MCKVYSSYCGTSEIEHGLCACTVDNPLAKARGLSLRTGAQTMLYLPLVGQRPTFRVTELSSVKNSNITEATGPTEAVFYMEPSWIMGTKLGSNGPGHMNKMASMPIFGKKNITNFLQTLKANDLNTLHVA